MEEIEKLQFQVIPSLFISEENELNLKRRAQSKIIEIAKEMGIMELGYYDITRSNGYIFSEILRRLNLTISRHLDSLNVLNVQKFCISITNVLSDCSFAIYEPDITSKYLVDGINFLSQISGEDLKGVEVQEKIGMLKEAVNLIYFETQNKDSSKEVQAEVTAYEIMNLLELEIAVILIFELNKSLKLDNNTIRLEKESSLVYSEKLKDINKVLQKMSTVKELLYGEDADYVMAIFKKVKGFNDESLYPLCDEFKNDETLSLKINDMRSLIQTKLGLTDRQLEYFISIMFLDYTNKEYDEVIKNVNCSLFTTPFIVDVKGMVWLNKSTLLEAAKYVRRRVINEDISLPRNLKRIIKEKINEKSLSIIKKELESQKIKCFINVDLAKDDVLKELFHGTKNTPHELDLYYVEDEVLKIYDLKNYLIPLSVKDSVVRIGNSINKETNKLHNLNKILESKHELIEERLKLRFNSIEYGILLTTDCYYSDKSNDVSVTFVDDFLEMLRKSKKIVEKE